MRRDLHDGLGSTLAALTARAEAARDLVPIRPQQRMTLLNDEAAVLPPLPAAVEVAVYRMVQEALSNVVDRAEAIIRAREAGLR